MMRLLQYNNTDDDFSLAEFFESDIPKYAILSHRWGAEEVTFKDLIDGTGKSKAGYSKIQFCGEQAKRDNLQYFWVDTCCIDKSSSAELQESINSMFRWYQRAQKCYVYLADVSTLEHRHQSTWEQAFRESIWFTRGWTLQELLAPRVVEFFSREGKPLGDKEYFESIIQEITGIDIEALQRTPLYNFGVNTRFSWAKGRSTTRQEDEAYSLLGIFGIFIPIIYGEGKGNAIDRLKKEIYDAARRNQGTIPQSLTSDEAVSGSSRPEPQWKALNLPKDHGAPVHDVAFSPYGNTLASASKDRDIAAKVWNLWSGAALQTLSDGHAGSLQATAFSPNGRMMMSASLDCTIRFWDVWSGAALQTLNHDYKSNVHTIAISPDGRTLALIWGHVGSICRLLDVQSRATLQTLKHDSGGSVHSVAFSPDGMLLAPGEGVLKGKARLWDIGSGAMLHTFKHGVGGPVYAVAFSLDGRTCASGSLDRTVKLWDVRSGEAVRTLKHEKPQDRARVHAVAFSPDGRMLASGSHDGTIRLWNVGSGEALRTLRGHTGIIHTVAFSTDGRMLASGSEDHTVRLWG